MCLYLPRHGEAAAEEEDVVSSDAVELSGEGQIILIIDDEPTIRMLTAEILSDAGYVVIEAPDGPAGLRVLEANAKIDMLITDVGLPGGLNGRQVADAARVSRPDLKVLFITGYAENSVIGNSGLSAGMHVLSKPFQMDEFANRVKEIIER